MVGPARLTDMGSRREGSGVAPPAPTGALQQRDMVPDMGFPPGALRPLLIPTCRKRCHGAYW
eukprot:9616493-Lingulodinium_polyedra.AAC.1